MAQLLIATSTAGLASSQIGQLQDLAAMSVRLSFEFPLGGEPEASVEIARTLIALGCVESDVVLNLGNHVTDKR